MENNDMHVYFSPDLSERERACFEAGIKLGALYHILCGIPISTDENVIKSIEKGIEAAISCQPYVKKVEVNLKRNEISGNKQTQFDYDEITGKIIRAKIIVEYEKTKITARVDWINEFPLMYIEKIQKKD
ncbi:MAG: hypothetical protein EU539_03140 [Promethearchaeota archaeon]|nr:MAG: hypothetical protein EU539_03140 [Candidatus Lokiarchaeota archaeon]